MRAIEKGTPIPEGEVFFYEKYSVESSLRKGILSAIIGIALILIPSIGSIISIEGMTDFFYIAGIITCAYGLGKLLVWFIVDKPKIDIKKQIKK